jgi:hypothetical protein
LKLFFILKFNLSSENREDVLALEDAALEFVSVPGSLDLREEKSRVLSGVVLVVAFADRSGHDSCWLGKIDLSFDANRLSTSAKAMLS